MKPSPPAPLPEGEGGAKRKKNTLKPKLPPGNNPPTGSAKIIGSHVHNPNRIHRESLTRLEKLAIWITDHVGTMGFFLIIFAWTIIWLTWNSLGPHAYRFDPFPGFVLWLFISNMIQIFLMPLIMIGQNLQSRHAEYRAESDYQVNLRAASEVETILTNLDRQNELIMLILKHLEATQPLPHIPKPDHAHIKTPTSPKQS